MWFKYKRYYIFRYFFLFIFCHYIAIIKQVKGFGGLQQFNILEVLLKNKTSFFFSCVPYFEVILRKYFHVYIILKLISYVQHFLISLKIRSYIHYMVLPTIKIPWLSPGNITDLTLKIWFINPKFSSFY